MLKMNDLNMIKEVVNNISQKKKIELFHKMQPIIEIVRNFVIEKKCILYGGLALNYLLPTHLRFYEKYDVPDYDVLSYNAFKDASDLADRFHQKGYDYVQVKPGLKDTTFRVQIEFNIIADFNQIDQWLYKNMLKMSLLETQLHNNGRLLIAPIYYLKQALYGELSRPSSIYRWEKVYGRTLLFNKIFESYTIYPKSYKHITFRDLIVESRDDVKDISEMTAKYIEENKIPIIGSFAIALYMRQKASCRYLQEEPIFEGLVYDVYKTFNSISFALENVLKKHKYRIYNKEFEYDKRILPKRLDIFLQHEETKVKINLVSLYEVSNNFCFSTISLGKYIVGNVFAVLTIMYSNILYKEKPKEIGDMTNMILFFERWVWDSGLNLANQFGENCFGYEKSPLSIKKERQKKKDFKSVLYEPL